MGKIKYLFRRIKEMNYKNFFSTIEEIHKKTKKPRIYLFFDIVSCGLKYQAGYLDYKLFELYNVPKKKRHTYLTRGINNSFIKKYNNPKFMPVFINKNEFNEAFDKYIGRKWILLNGDNKDEFIEFIQGKSEVMAKPVNSTHGSGITKIKPTSDSYEELMANGQLLIEEVIKQDERMARLNSSSVNTVRFVSLYKDGECYIVTAYLRVGNGKVVDNFNGGGMVVPVNLDTGKVDFPAMDKKGNIYHKHPISNIDIIGFEIPQFEEAKKLISEACKVIEQVQYVGWDVCFTPNGPVLIEGNEFPGHDIYQLPPHRKDDIGVLEEFKRRTNNNL